MPNLELDWYHYPWLETAINALISVLALMATFRIGMVALRRLTQSKLVAVLLLRQTQRALECILVLLGLELVWDSAPADLYLIGLVERVTAILLIAAFTWAGIEVIRGGSKAVIELHPLDIDNNLAARRLLTQTRVMSKVLMGLVGLIGFAMILMSFPGIRQVGMSLLASAGVAGLVAGIAARPVLANLIAGLQIALSQPIRLDDVVVIEGHWGRIEEITGTYVVVKIWDERQLIVPLQWLIEHPFQNWTHGSARIIGTVFMWVDYRMPLQPLREELDRVCQTAADWDGRVAKIQVTEAGERGMQLRVLLSSVDASRNWDLRCFVREALVQFVQVNYPEYLPTTRVIDGGGEVSRGAATAQTASEGFVSS